jgi:hypothetical protein
MGTGSTDVRDKKDKAYSMYRGMPNTCQEQRCRKDKTN